MLQKINNNHIPKIYDVELTDKTVVIEEFVQGITLNEFMENHFEFWALKGQKTRMNTDKNGVDI